jgi:glycosyltransferase involved in cell wall biosynthesis
MHKPLVSVLMPVYNGEKYLIAAVNSILNQNYENIELIIINDGSVDSTEKIISKYKDSRIIYIKNEKNLGLVQTLNNGFNLCKGKYIARMDCDDISFTERLAKQVNFMESNIEYGMCGTQYVHLNTSRQPHKIGAQLISDFEIKLGINSLNCFCHGAIMFRTTFLKENKLNYLQEYSPYEDYELWTRITQMTKVANLSEVLYAYMDNPDGMFLTRQTEMIEGPKKLSRRLNKKMQLPKINLLLINRLWDKKNTYRDKKIDIQGVLLNNNFTLAYQTFLYKLGRIYISRSNLLGILLLVMSFTLNPLNWFKKIIYG